MALFLYILWPLTNYKPVMGFHMLLNITLLLLYKGKIQVILSLKTNDRQWAVMVGKYTDV